MSLKLYGALLFAAFLFAILLLYRRSEARRFAEYEGLYLLLRHTEEQLASFCRPLPEVYASFENEALLRCGFLSRLREEGLSSALKSGTLSLDRAALAPFLDFSKDLGSRCLAEELSACREARARIGPLLEGQRAELPRRCRVASTVILSSGMMLLLLLL